MDGKMEFSARQEMVSYFAPDHVLWRRGQFREKQINAILQVEGEQEEDNGGKNERSGIDQCSLKESLDLAFDLHTGLIYYYQLDL